MNTRVISAMEAIPISRDETGHNKLMNNEQNKLKPLTESKKEGNTYRGGV